MTSAFSPAEHSRFSTSLQLRLNHFSTAPALVKRSGLNAGASGVIGLPVLAWAPGRVGGLPWHVAHDQSPPWVVLKNCSPLCAEGLAPPDAAL